MQNVRNKVSYLDTIGIRHNCDKSSVDRQRNNGNVEKGGHDYLRKYEFFIQRFKQKDNLRLLELGIGPNWNMGASLKVWQDYFNLEGQNFTIVDINPNAKKFASKHVHIEVGDLGSQNFLDQISKQKYDIIIDDASHFWEHQILALKSLISSLNPGGVFIVEDIQTSFGKMRDRYSQGYNVDAFEFITALSAAVAGDNAAHSALKKIGDKDSIRKITSLIESITIIRHSCIICSKGYYYNQ